MIVESIPVEAHERGRARGAVRIIDGPLDLAEHLVKRVEIRAGHALAVERVTLIREHGKDRVGHARFERRKRRSFDAEKRIVEGHA